MVENDEIDRFAGGRGGAQLRQRGQGAVGGAIGEIPRRAEMDEQLSIRGVVVDDQRVVVGSCG
jgi:hypothetical protein